MMMCVISKQAMDNDKRRRRRRRKGVSVADKSKPQKWRPFGKAIQQESHFVLSPNPWRRHQLQLLTKPLPFPIDSPPSDIFAVVEILSLGIMKLFLL